MTYFVLEPADYVQRVALELDESIESLAKMRHKEDKEQNKKKYARVIIVRPPVHHGRAAASIVLRL